MTEKIKKYLDQIQEEKGIEILLACETGSRAWGFPSPDSDFDIRFIYRHTIDWYLSLNEQKDTVEIMLENKEFDLVGWDIKKCLNLLWKSNPPLLEKIQSPIIYYANPDFAEGIKVLAAANYSKIATMHHYLSMAKKMFSEVENKKEVKLKKLFYALRTSIACKWIMEKNEMPPIDFCIMLEELKMSISIKNRIYELIALKATKEEAYLHNEEKELNIFIEYVISECDHIASSLPSGKGSIDDMNTFFRTMIYKA